MTRSVRPRLLLFDPYAGGHHAEHILHLLRAWRRRDEVGWLVATVAPSLLRLHPELESCVFEESDRGVRLVPVEDFEALNGAESRSLRQVAQLNGSLLKGVVGSLNPQRVHALYLDHLQLALARRIGLPDQVCVSGLLFRPDFHYGHFDPVPPILAERARRIRKKLLLRAAMRHPAVRAILTLDTTAVAPIRSLTSRVRVEAVPEPMDTAGSIDSPAAVREKLGVDQNRKLLVSFGRLDERKGVPATLEALARLDDEVCGKISLLLAGRIATGDRALIEQRIHGLAQRPVQVLLREGFVPDSEVQTLLGAADLVLVPYQRHVGSSGVLVRAAGAGRPVLSQDYGFMGQQVRLAQLGQAVDTTRADVLAQAILTFLKEPTTGFDRASALAFAARNTPDGYADATLDIVLSV